jgi:hypothetical protein
MPSDHRPHPVPERRATWSGRRLTHTSLPHPASPSADMLRMWPLPGGSVSYSPRRSRTGLFAGLVLSLLLTTAGSGTAWAQTYTLTVSAEHGSVAKVPDQPSYAPGDTVRLTASADTSYHFASWTGDVVSSDNPVVVVMDGDRNVTAGFAADFTLTVGATHGTVLRDPDRTSYPPGTVVTLTAVPDRFYGFTSWSGALIGSDNPTTITMDGDRSVDAAFAATSEVTFDVGSVTTTISPDTSCVDVPITVTRTGSDTLRAFSVRIQLPPELQLCTPVTPGGVGSFREGGFLSSSGRPAAIVVIDHGDNSYTVDGMILGLQCGDTPAAGTILTVGVTSASTTACQGTISIVPSVLPRMRDCSNRSLPTVIGTAGTVPIDRNDPVVTLAGADTMIVECHGDFTDPGASALDACAGVVTVGASGVVNPDSVADYAVLYSADDGHGNVGTATRIVRVLDRTAPAFADVPADITVHTGPGASGCAAVASWTPPTASDSCADAIVPTADHAPGDEFPAGVTTVTYRAEDPSGNFATASFTVTVVDSTAPALHDVPADLVVGTAPGATTCAALATWTPPTATDNCPGTVTLDADHHPGDEFPAGTTTVTYTATDAGGNQITASFTVTVVDSTPPVLHDVPAAVAAHTGPGATACAAVATWAAPTATDNCSGTVTVGADHASGDEFPVGETTVTYTATDAAGNPTHGSFVVTVADSTPPSLHDVPAPIVLTTGPGATSCGAIATWAPPTATDNCTGTPAVTADHASGDVFPVGVTTVTCTATDAAGNQAHGPFTVTVSDDTPPVVALTAPVGSETWIIGTTHAVTWTPATDNCALDCVDLVLSRDGGLTWPDTLAAHVDNSGSFSWAIPGPAAPHARVRVIARDAAGNVTASSSAADVTLSGITHVSGLTARLLTSGNDAGGTAKIRLSWTPTQPGTTVELWRRGYGNYPEYDDPPSPGAVPAAPVSYPPPGWTLAQSVTGVATVDDAIAWPGRDFWYYVAYTRADTVISAPSTRTSGTLDYILGDVTDGYTPGQGDNVVDGVDLSALGAHYGLTGPAMLAYDYLDVGPTANGWVDGMPVTDSQLDFEDFVLFGVDYGIGSGTRPTLARPEAVAGVSDALTLERPELVAAGEATTARLLVRGSGNLRALSVTLAWDADVVQPTDAIGGGWLAAQRGMMLSPRPGRLDAVSLQAGGLAGEGELASVSFRVLEAGDPAIRVAAVDARDLGNHGASLDVTEKLIAAVPARTELSPAAPNPFAATATLAFALAHGGRVELAIYSVDGRHVRTLVRGTLEPGRYHEVWDGRDDHGTAVPAGVYYARFTAPDHRATRTVVYMR